MDDTRLTLGSVRGIDVRIHRSWLLIALLIAWSFSGRFGSEGRGIAVTLVMAAAGTLLFFGSILAHELAHSLEAQRRGVHVHGITLFLFGGATETRFDVQRPRDEFALTAVGPFSSFVLGAAFALVTHYGGRAGLDAVATVSGTLAWVNVALGVFNLLPGAPLDGGRLLRSIVWAATKDRQRAVRIAGRSGQAMGYAIIGLGVLQLFFVPGALVGGIWFVFIGWFLSTAARSEIVQHQLRESLRGVTVGEFADTGTLPSIEASASLDEAAGAFRRRTQDVLAIEHQGRHVGILRVDDVADVPRPERPDRRVDDLAVAIDDLPTVSPDTELTEVLDRAGGDRPIVITDDGGVVHGLLTPDQLQRILVRSLQLEGPPPRRGQASGRRRSHIPSRGGA